MKSNSDTKISKEEFMQRIKNAIWTCESFHFPVEHSIKYINSGLLGYQTNKDGTEKIDKCTGKPILKTISRSTFFRYKKESSALPQMYKDLRDFALEGYLNIQIGFREELKTLHRLTVQNLMSLQDPLQKQQIIDSLIKNVIPTQSAFADMLKKMIESNKLKPKNENQPEPKDENKDETKR